MFEIIYLIFMILFLFGITIFVHEWGHFIVARKCGLKVEAFAIGMGPALIKKTIQIQKIILIKKYFIINIHKYCK